MEDKWKTLLGWEAEKTRYVHESYCSMFSHNLQYYQKNKDIFKVIEKKWVWTISLILCTTDINKPHPTLSFSISFFATFPDCVTVVL